MCDEILKKTSGAYTSKFLDSTLAYNCSLDPFVGVDKFRATGIVCTVGPASANVDTIVEMINSGMTIARHNFSHGTHDDHKKMMDIVKTARSKVSDIHPIAIALDTKGPEIRTGLNKDGATITLVKDETITITTDDSHKELSTKDKLYIDYKSLATSIKVGQIILVADGSVVLRATAINGNDVVCTIISGASFGSRKNVCLPLVKTDLPALSEKDVSDIKFGIDQQVDMIFASFIRNADNVREIRKILNTSPYGKNIKIISKVENYEGIHNISEIVDESDGVMVARGDLGMDLDLERVVIAQKKIISMCNLKGKPVICATQMLESMIGSYRPTRAEVSDVTNANFDGSDCVMLSGETANGKYPVQTVKFMDIISRCSEKVNRSKLLFNEITESLTTMTELESVSMMAVEAAYKLPADAIFVLTTTGLSAHKLSMFRPSCPVFTITRSQEVARSSHLYRSLYPLYYKESPLSNWCEDVRARFKFALKHAWDTGFIKKNSKVVFVSGSQQGPGFTNTVRVATVCENGCVPIFKC